MLRTASHLPTSGTQTLDYYATGEMSQVTLPYGGTIRWTYGEWTSASQRIVREVNQRWLRQSVGGAETPHSLWTDPADTGREYHRYRGISDATGLYDKVWWFAADRALDFFEERKAGGVSTVRIVYTWATTPTSNQPYISQVETTLEPGTANAKLKRSIQNLDQYGT
jgi:hypothetical protein